MTRSRRVCERVNVGKLSRHVLEMLALNIESFLPNFAGAFSSLTLETRLVSEHLPWKSATCFASEGDFQVPKHFRSAKGIVVVFQINAVVYHITLAGPHEHVKFECSLSTYRGYDQNFPVIASITTVDPVEMRLELCSVNCCADALINLSTPWVLVVPTSLTLFSAPLKNFVSYDSDDDSVVPSCLERVITQSPHLQNIHFVGSYFARNNEAYALSRAIERFGFAVLQPVITPYRESGFYEFPELNNHEIEAFVPNICGGELKLYRPSLCVLYNLPLVYMATLRTCVLEDAELCRDSFIETLEVFLRKCPRLESWTIRTNRYMYDSVCFIIHQELLPREGRVGLTVSVSCSHQMVSVYQKNADAIVELYAI